MRGQGAAGPMGWGRWGSFWAPELRISKDNSRESGELCARQQAGLAPTEAVADLCPTTALELRTAAAHRNPGCHQHHNQWGVGWRAWP